MIKRFCATFLCLWAVFSPATWAAAPDDAFRPLDKPLSLPPILSKAANGPDITTQDIVRSAARDGRHYIHLWAPSCPPCVQELRELDAAYPLLKERGIHVLALAQDAQGDVTVPFFARRYGIKNISLYVDARKSAWLALGARGIPTTYRLNKEGQAEAVHEGAINWTRVAR